MTRFVKVDGKWFNPDHIVAVVPSKGTRPGFSTIVTTVGDYIVSGSGNDVITEICKG